MALREDEFGLMNHSKGIVPGTDFQFTSWDMVRLCGGEECPISGRCIYWRDGENQRLTVCKVEKTYLRSQRNVFMPLILKHPDPFIIQAIGDHIIPFYHDYCKVLMQIEAMGSTSILYSDKAMKQYITPLFREKREISTHIYKVMRESGIIDYAKRNGFYVGSGPSNALPGIEKPGMGDPEWTQKMYKKG